MGAKGFWVLLLLIVAGCAGADSDPDPDRNSQGSTYLPEFREPPEVIRKSQFGAESALPVIREVRVQIFPHIGNYVIPQGLDEKLTQVLLRSSGTCKKIKARSDAVEPLKPLEVSLEASSLSFDLADMKNAWWVSCSSPATLVRPEPLKSYAYAGDFYLKRKQTADGRPYILVVNLLMLDEYIKGVVPAEMPATWHDEALKAQTVAARTYASEGILRVRELDPSREYDVDDTVHDQAYLGITNRTPKTDAAVEATPGEVLFYQQMPIVAYFASDTGGYTEIPLHVWGKDLPYFVSRPEVYDLSLIKSEWTKLIPADELNSKLIARKVIPAGSRVDKITVIERYPSARAAVMELALTNGSTVRIKPFDFRLFLGLKSTWFQFEKQNDGSWNFTGRGYGHAVGLSQWGAQILSTSMNWTYRQILDFYYVGVELGNISPKP